MRPYAILSSRKEGYQSDSAIRAAAEGLDAPIYTLEDAASISPHATLVTFGVRDTDLHAAIHTHRGNGGNWLELNHPWLGTSFNVARFSLNGLFPAYNPAATVKDDRLHALNLPLAPHRPREGYLLVLPHTSSIAAFTGVDNSQWIEELAARSPLPVKVRHRRSPVRLEDDLAGAAAVAGFNSATLVKEALCDGHAVMGDPRGSILGSLTRFDPAHPRWLGDSQRAHLLAYLAQCQGTLEEIATPGFVERQLEMQREMAASLLPQQERGRA